VRFWDSSALVPLLVSQPSSDLAGRLLSEDADTVLWWATQVELESAFARLRREAVLDEAEIGVARALFADLYESALEIEPSQQIRRRAIELLADHPLRAADALQLAASLSWVEQRPAGEGFVSFDDRLRGAARSEGFTVLPRDLPSR